MAVAGFGLCSAAAMLAGSFGLLVGLRAGQAAFAAALSPSVQAMLREVTTPAERGRAFGLQNSVIGIGAGLGPVIGGVLTGVFGWRAIFGVNLPIVLVVLAVLRRSVPAARTVPAAAAGGSAGEVARAARGRSADRLVNPVFVSAFGTQALSTLAQYALLLVTPIVLDDRGWGSAEIGLALSALTIGLIVMSPVGGRIGDRRGRRLPAVAGLAVCATAVGATALFGDDAASALLIGCLGVFGLGLGTVTPSVLAAGMEAAPAVRVGLASGLLSASRYVGSIVASLLLAALVDDAGNGVGAMLMISAAALVASVGAATPLPSRATHRPP
jgi:MFS family permease